MRINLKILACSVSVYFMSKVISCHKTQMRDVDLMINVLLKLQSVLSQIRDIGIINDSILEK